MPVELIVGCTANKALLSFVTRNVSVWPVSPGPCEMPLAQLVTVRATPSAAVFWFAPLVNEGASLTLVIVIDAAAAAVL